MNAIPMRAALLLPLVVTVACATMPGTRPAKTADGVLVGAADGMTLYTFDRDAAGAGKSACNGPCATMWPPLTASAYTMPAGDWTVVTRDDGTRQWAYKGKPLYFFQNDKKAGDRHGDNYRGVWHVVKD